MCGGGVKSTHHPFSVLVRFLVTHFVCMCQHVCVVQLWFGNSMVHLLCASSGGELEWLDFFSVVVWCGVGGCVGSGGRGKG